MRAVVDTNLLISGALWAGPPARLLDAIRAGRLQPVQSPELWAEFVEVLHRPKFAARLRLVGLTPTQLTEAWRRHVTWIPNATISIPPGLRDPKDLMVLAAAVAGKVEAVVTGDAHLLALNSFKEIPILTVRQALEKLGVAAE